MGNLNKVMLIGRLTRDPEIREFSNGGKVANIGFAVNRRVKDKDSGEWKEIPVWLDLKAFSNAGGGRKLADLAEKYLRKGQQIFVEGHLRMDEWEAKDGGGKRSKLVIYVDDIQFVEKRSDGPAGGGGAGGGAKSEENLEDVPF